MEDCRLLFERQQNSLSGSWQQYFFLVPAAYKAEDGFALGTWVRTRRKTRRGLMYSRALTKEQIKHLDVIGMHGSDCDGNQPC